MAWITKGDFIDVWAKLRQRGRGFIFSKLNPSKVQRTKSAFNESSVTAANWWIIPAVKRRWNKLITGDPIIDYETYMMETHFRDHRNLRMLSIGSGVCSHEIKLASFPQFDEIVCVDLVQSLLDKAKSNAELTGLTNIKFRCADIYKDFKSEEPFDIVFFHASLHHFYDIDSFIKNHVLPILKPKGHIVINEYVGPDRLQFDSKRLSDINHGLQLIDNRYRERFMSSATKDKFYGSGLLRMILADPSECVDSSQILPVLHKYATPIIERNYGGNILMHALKDIAHNFVEDTDEDQKQLQDIFDFEDEYLKGEGSDFVFGIYGV